MQSPRSREPPPTRPSSPTRRIQAEPEPINSLSWRSTAERTRYAVTRVWIGVGVHLIVGLVTHFERPTPHVGVPLDFVGAGASAGQDFREVTDAQGEYSDSLPDDLDRQHRHDQRLPSRSAVSGPCRPGPSSMADGLRGFAELLRRHQRSERDRHGRRPRGHSLPRSGRSSSCWSSPATRCGSMAEPTSTWAIAWSRRIGAGTPALRSRGPLSPARR